MPVDLNRAGMFTHSTACRLSATCSSPITESMSRQSTSMRAAVLIQTVTVAVLVLAAKQAIGAATHECQLLLESLTDTQAAKYSLAQQHCDIGEATERSATRRPHAAQLALFAASAGRIVVPGVDTPAQDPEPTYAVPPKIKRQPLLMTSDVTKRSVALAPDIDATARRHNIDPLLLHAIAHVESRHNVSAVSPAGARGLMQIMPATGRRFGVEKVSELHDARTNLDVSATYLKKLQERFGNDLPLVLAAYNAGEGAVEKHGRNIPPYKETQNYVREVLSRYDLLSAASKQSNAATSRLN